MLLKLFCRPYRFFLIAAALALLLCLLPIRTQDAQRTGTAQRAEGADQLPAEDVPAGADLSERTVSGCYLHRTLYYTPCGHSIQRRDLLNAELIGLTRQALEKELPVRMPGTAITGFSSKEVDAAVSVDIPCPLHWVLKSGEDGLLHIYQNRDGETLSLVRSTDIPVNCVNESERETFYEGRIFDDVQALEGVLESMSS